MKLPGHSHCISRSQVNASLDYSSYKGHHFQFADEGDEETCSAPYSKSNIKGVNAAVVLELKPVFLLFQPLYSGLSRLRSIPNSLKQLLKHRRQF